MRYVLSLLLFIMFFIALVVGLLFADRTETMRPQQGYQYVDPDTGIQHQSMYGLTYPHHSSAVAPVFIIILALLLVPAILLALPSRSKKQARATQEEETRIMQEIHHGLLEMEKRIENVETIIFETRSGASRR